VNSPRALPPAELATLLPASFPSVEIHQNLQSAFDVPAALPTLVTGSAFLVGEVKALLDDSPHRPSTQ